MTVGKAILESLSGDAERLGELQAVLTQIEAAIGGKRFLISALRLLQGTWAALKNNVLQLGKLPSEQCWSTFSRVTFFDRDNEERERLESIGRYIIEKCDSLPLSAKALGSLLRLKSSVQEWRNVLDSEL
ncbi:putative disease resistance protein RGA3 [Ricinus communis]|uniref:putative disease resistance protein RGA3 n=1 Tax=Ricinus communis TaxID=3988 RepID=UPI0007729C10|nr:putative disease resistance protein RGA3 [Ricinus communis]